MWSNLSVLTLLLSLCLEDVGGFKHLKKLFAKKDGVKECDIVWTEMVQPHCETIEEEVCETLYEDVCTVEYTEQCRQLHEPVCHTDYSTECKTTYSQQCETEQIQQCKTEYSQACSSWPKCWEVEEEKCSVKYQKICTADLAMPEPVYPEEQQEKTRTKRSDLQHLQKKHHYLQKQKDIAHHLLSKRETRTKRFAHHLLKKLVSTKVGGDDEKDKEELCHHVPHKHCVVVPVEKCEDVEECHDVPEEKCWQEPQERCWEEPEESCWQEPRETCTQEAREVCQEKPHESCHQVPREQCSQVPQEHCEYLPKLVAKKQCKDKKEEDAWTISDLRGSIKTLLGRA